MIKRRPLMVMLTLIAVSCVSYQAGRVSSDGTQPNVTVQARQASAESSANRPIAPPVIGIASLTSDTYVRAIRDCGGIPVVLPNADGSPDRIDEYLVLLDGLVMPGGADIARTTQQDHRPCF